MQVVLVEMGDVESSRVLGAFIDPKRALAFLRAKVKRERRLWYRQHHACQSPSESTEIEAWYIESPLYCWLRARLIDCDERDV